jgi:hypothetical protein
MTVRGQRRMPSASRASGWVQPRERVDAREKEGARREGIRYAAAVGPRLERRQEARIVESPRARQRRRGATERLPGRPAWKTPRGYCPAHRPQPAGRGPEGQPRSSPKHDAAPTGRNLMTAAGGHPVVLTMGTAFLRLPSYPGSLATYGSRRERPALPALLPPGSRPDTGPPRLPEGGPGPTVPPEPAYSTDDSGIPRAAEIYLRPFLGRSAPRAAFLRFSVQIV